MKCRQTDFLKLLVTNGYLYVFPFVFFFFRNVSLVTTEMAAVLSWDSVFPVSATVSPMSVKTGQGGAW